MNYESPVGPIFYQVHGSKDKPAIVFTHGGGLHSGMYDTQVADFKDDYLVITWDMQGHGQSAPLKKNLDVILMADILFGIMDEVGIEKTIAVGQSLGVYVNQHAALKHPDRIRALVHIGGLPIDVPMNPMELFMFKALMPVSRLFPENLLIKRTANEKTTTEDARAFFKESLHAMGKDQFLLMLDGQLDACELPVPEAPGQPILITHGEHEMPKSLIKGNRQWHESVPGSVYHEIPNAGHNANQDNPEFFNKILKDFITSL